jgi:hypothetical protein
MNEEIINSLLTAGTNYSSPPLSKPTLEDVAPGAASIMRYGDKNLNYVPGGRESENVNIEYPKDQSALMAIIGALIGKNFSGFPNRGSSDHSKTLPPVNLQSSMFTKNVPGGEEGNIPSANPKPTFADTLPIPRHDIDYGAIDKKAGEIWATHPSLDIKSLNLIKDKMLTP